MLDLDKDPTPGDPHRVRSLAKNLHDFADDVSKVLRDIKGMAGEDAILQWAGKTADAFTEKFEDAPDKLKKLKKSYEMAGDALSAYWPELERAQTLADKALVKGREAQADLSSAKSRLSSADSWVERAGKEADKYKDDKGSGGSKSKDVPKPDEDKVRAATRNAHSAEKAQKSAQGDVDAAKSALDAAKKMAEDARKMREEAAGTAKRKIDEASDAGIQNRKWWEEIGDWVTDNWDAIVAVCKVVVAVVGVIAIIIGGPILAAIVIVAGAIVLADTLNKYAKGQAGLMDVAFAALDCVPGMKGLTTAAKLGKGLKGLKGGLKGFKSARTALKDGAKGAYNRVKSVVRSKGSDPVDMATGQMFLIQTDIELPGSLPLSFTRRVASGYRCGGWFGPTWSSTIDQRLEIDDQGIVLVTEDGMLLAYPHPQTPDNPVMSDSGPRWPLIRLADGGYQVTDPASGLRRVFSPPDGEVALLSRIADRNDSTIDFEYDSQGAPISIRHSGGYVLKFAVDQDRVTGLHLGGGDADVIIKTYGYTDGILTSVTNAGGHSLSFSCDDRMRITSWIDSNDRKYTYNYDDQDRCVSEGGEAGHLAITLDYDGTDPDWPGSSIVTLTTAEGAVSRFVVNDSCQVIAEIDPLGGTVRTVYDEHHQILSLTDEVDCTTRFTNNELGQPVRITSADGSVFQYEYDAMGNPTAGLLPDGSRWTRAYDERGNCTAVTDTSGATYLYTYDASGHLDSITDPLGRTTAVECDSVGLPYRSTNPLGGVQLWERDAAGNLVSHTDPLGHSTLCTWTPEGLLASRTAPDGATETWEYDGEGNCVRHVDPAGATTVFEYGHFDLLTSRLNPDGGRYSFEHDPSLRLTRISNPQGLEWCYTYDRAGRLIRESDFDDRTLTYTHDPAGRVTSRTDSLGHTIRYTYDALGRISWKDANGRVTEFTYDESGELARVIGSESEITFRRDRAGRVIEERVDGRSLNNEYNALGQRIRRTTPSGAVTTQAYDAAGNQIELTTSGHAIRFDRDKAGQEICRHIDGYAQLANRFDEVGRLTSQHLATPDRPSEALHTYTYRPGGDLVRLHDRSHGTRSFELDAMGRVRTVCARNWTEYYDYDPAGNQTAADWTGAHPDLSAAGSREYTGTRITRAGKTRYEYDALGRVLLRQVTRLSRKPDTWRYEWDAEDRLIGTVTPDGACWRYRYDPLGRRTAKQRLATDGVTVLEETTFVWDGSFLCEQTTRHHQRPQLVSLTWNHDGLHPVAQTERITAVGTPQQEIDSRFFAIVTNVAGMPNELLAEDGCVAWQARFTLWGKLAWGVGSTAFIPLRFPGQYDDLETGFHYNYFRHYDPATARYISPDPLGISPAPNPVTYVTNPHRWTDPLGLSPYAAVDTNPMIDALNGSRTADVDAALAGRSPVLSPQAHRELIEGGHDPQAISKWLSDRGGRMGPESTPEGVADIQGRLKAMWKGKSFNPMIKDDDASVLHSAAQEGLPLITNDKKFYQNAERLGYTTERY
ncbi:DUF6531 domain-containing protein [Streptomyces sp. NPDC093510]|uniref:DUF6531 domain-containing protein n=1 Tax=Streptomyces sp. NPDC093510 TaxID=3155199 RepID=UPI0034222CB7